MGKENSDCDVGFVGGDFFFLKEGVDREVGVLRERKSPPNDKRFRCFFIFSNFILFRLVLFVGCTRRYELKTKLTEKWD
jgi:hypothetical protein